MVWRRLVSIAALSFLFTTIPIAGEQAHAQKGTVQIPTCLTFLGNGNGNKNVYQPCNGVIPVDADGNPLGWEDLLKGSSSSPNHTALSANGNDVSDSNPLPVNEPIIRATIGPVGTTAPIRTQAIGGVDGAGNLQSFRVDSAGVLQVNCPSCSGSGGGTGGSNSAASAIGTDIPAYGSYTAYLGADNKLHGWVGDNSGHPLVSIFGTAVTTVTNFPATQAVSASTLPLPTGAATATAQTTANDTLATISQKLDAPTPAGDAVIGKTGSNRVHRVESTTPLAANATFMSPMRDDGGTMTGVPTGWDTFGCFVHTDVNAVLNVQASNDGTAWFTVATTTITANASYFLSHELVMQYWRCNVINGNTAQTHLVVNSVFGR